MKREKPIVRQNLKLAAVFFVCIFLLLAVSLLVKIGAIVAKSSFDSQHRFNILVTNERENNIFSFAPDTNTITILQMQGNLSLGDFRRTFEMPIDGLISKKEHLDPIDKRSSESIFRNLILNYKNIKTNLTIVDFVRIWLFARTVKYDDVTIRKIILSKTELILKGDSFIDKISMALFVDSSIVSEKVNIQIINGTDVAGLGNRLARLVTNIGGSVIAVSSADKEIEKSAISYFGSETYTLKRLNKILGFNINKEQKQGIADMTITIGKDALSKLVY